MSEIRSGVALLAKEAAVWGPSLCSLGNSWGLLGVDRVVGAKHVDRLRRCRNFGAVTLPLQKFFKLGTQHPPLKMRINTGVPLAD
jgi:hypothetical protein